MKNQFLAQNTRLYPGTPIQLDNPACQKISICSNEREARGIAEPVQGHISV